MTVRHTERRLTSIFDEVDDSPGGDVHEVFAESGRGFEDEDVAVI
jgi:hypothetical protein